MPPCVPARTGTDHPAAVEAAASGFHALDLVSVKDYVATRPSLCKHVGPEASKASWAVREVRGGQGGGSSRALLGKSVLFVCVSVCVCVTHAHVVRNYVGPQASKVAGWGMCVGLRVGGNEVCLSAEVSCVCAGCEKATKQGRPE